MSVFKVITKTFDDKYGNSTKHFGAIASATVASALVVAAKKNPVLLPIAYGAIGACTTICVIDGVDRTQKFVKNQPNKTFDEKVNDIIASFNKVAFNTSDAKEFDKMADEVAANVAEAVAETTAEVVDNIKETLDKVDDKADDVADAVEETVTELNEQAAKKAEEAADEFLQKAEEDIKEIKEGIEKAKKTKGEKPLSASPEAPKKMPRKTTPKQEVR